MLIMATASSFQSYHFFKMERKCDSLCTCAKVPECGTVPYALIRLLATRGLNIKFINTVRFTGTFCYFSAFLRWLKKNYTHNTGVISKHFHYFSDVFVCF
jgi:hypothetical protein